MARGGGHFCYAGWAEWGEYRGGGKRAAPRQEMLGAGVCVVCCLYMCLDFQR